MKLTKKEIEKIINLANESNPSEANKIVQVYYPEGFISGNALEFSIHKNKEEILESIHWNLELNCYQSEINKELFY